MVLFPSSLAFQAAAKRLDTLATSALGLIAADLVLLGCEHSKAAAAAREAMQQARVTAFTTCKLVIALRQDILIG